MKIGLHIRNPLCPRNRASRCSIALLCLVLMLCAPLVASSNEHDDEAAESEESEDRVAELEAQPGSDAQRRGDERNQEDHCFRTIPPLLPRHRLSI